MTREYEISIQPGHIARHTPRNAGAQGREAAVVDIAQDLLLRCLHDEGLLDGVAIKGGTAIRKLYAGNEGRFRYRFSTLSGNAFPCDASEMDALLSSALKDMQHDVTASQTSRLPSRDGHCPDGARLPCIHQ